METVTTPHAAGGASAAVEPLDVARIREDFPVLNQTVNGRPLVYLDNAATSQKPRAVMDRMYEYYTRENSTVRRGVHYLSERSTFAHDQARLKVANLLNAGDTRQIVFTRGTTEAINLVASGFEHAILGEGDEVLITQMEHHANIVPWQLACQRTGATLRVVPIDERGELVLDELERLLTPRTKILGVTHVSNALGTVNPIRRIVEMAHANDVPVLVDGAQGVPHTTVDVQELGADFYAFSGHKIFGPTGIGVLYGTAEWLDRLPPYQGGGDMILSVTFEKTIYNSIPHKFEAGTPAIADTIGLGVAIDYVTGIGLDRIGAWERELLDYATERVSAIPGLRIIGTAREKASVLSFSLEQVHPHDIGTVLDQEGIAIRVGHHCAQPVMQCFNVPATARASFAFYNTREDVDALVRGIEKCIEVFG
jgi:cysteine desulfurase / selenocysteine lyase